MNQRTSQAGSSSYRCLTTLCRMQKEMMKYVKTIQRQLKKYAEGLSRGHWSFLGPGSGEKWYGSHTDKPDGSWNQPAKNMMANFSGTGLPIFRASSAFERGEIRSKGGNKSIHLNGSHENIELFLRTVISANQLSMYGAIADLSDKVPKGIRASVKLAAFYHLEKMEILTDLSVAENSTNAQQRGNLVQEYERKFEQFSENPEIMQTTF